MTRPFSNLFLDFATNYLQLDYVFWCTEEPFYSQEVLPLLKLGKR